MPRLGLVTLGTITQSYTLSGHNSVPLANVGLFLEADDHRATCYLYQMPTPQHENDPRRKGLSGASSSWWNLVVVFWVTVAVGTIMLWLVLIGAWFNPGLAVEDAAASHRRPQGAGSKYRHMIRAYNGQTAGVFYNLAGTESSGSAAKLA